MAGVAIVTGGSRGLGRAVAGALVERGWEVVIDGRDRLSLEAARGALGSRVTAVAGDVADPGHRRQLLDAAHERGPVSALVNNASVLGPSPLPSLAGVGIDEVRRVVETNAIAPLALAQLVLPDARAVNGSILNVTSDAAVEAYEGWGVYGLAKAALEQWGAVLAAEEPDVRVYTVDPGDMRTQMHQDAFPGEDISDRPEPAVSVPGILMLLEGDLPSGRYRAREVAPSPAGATR